jgi:hypothetical protein
VVNNTAVEKQSEIFWKLRFSVAVSSVNGKLLAGVLRPRVCTEKSVRNYHYLLRYGPDYRSFPLLRSGSPRSNTKVLILGKWPTWHKILYYVFILVIADGCVVLIQFCSDVLVYLFCSFCIAKFYILLTVHHVMILGKWPSWGTILLTFATKTEVLVANVR